MEKNEPLLILVNKNGAVRRRMRVVDLQLRGKIRSYFFANLIIRAYGYTQRYGFRFYEGSRTRNRHNADVGNGNGCGVRDLASRCRYMVRRADHQQNDVQKARIQYRRRGIGSANRVNTRAANAGRIAQTREVVSAALAGRAGRAAALAGRWPIGCPLSRSGCGRALSLRDWPSAALPGWLDFGPS